MITLCRQKRGSQINMSYHGKPSAAHVRDPDGARSCMDFFDRAEIRVARLCARWITSSRNTASPTWSRWTS
ncbi:hypothetical protein ACU4GD_02750 [Cupriavidus basilensis]